MLGRDGVRSSSIADTTSHRMFIQLERPYAMACTGMGSALCSTSGAVTRSSRVPSVAPARKSMTPVQGSVPRAGCGAQAVVVSH